MVFSSTIFLFLFLPATLIVYYVLPVKWRNAWLLENHLFYVPGDIYDPSTLPPYKKAPEKVLREWMEEIVLARNYCAERKAKTYRRQEKRPLKVPE
jgi:hypothetical protein